MSGSNTLIREVKKTLIREIKKILIREVKVILVREVELLDRLYERYRLGDLNQFEAH